MAEINAMTQTYLMVEIVSRERERVAREERRLREVIDIYSRRSNGV